MYTEHRIPHPRKLRNWAWWEDRTDCAEQELAMAKQALWPATFLHGSAPNPSIFPSLFLKTPQSFHYLWFLHKYPIKILCCKIFFLVSDSKFQIPIGSKALLSERCSRDPFHWVIVAGVPPNYGAWSPSCDSPETDQRRLIFRLTIVLLCFYVYVEMNSLWYYPTKLMLCHQNT